MESYPGLGYFLGNSIIIIGIIAVIVGAIIKLWKYINRRPKELKIDEEGKEINTAQKR